MAVKRAEAAVEHIQAASTICLDRINPSSLKNWHCCAPEKCVFEVNAEAPP